MNDFPSDGLRRKQFYYGMILTWIPLIPLGVLLFNLFRGISEQKATGLGAVAGGLAEAYATFGLILVPILAVGAIVLLVRSFSRDHRLRGLVSVLHICANIVALGFVTVSVWVFFVYLPHAAPAHR